MLNQIIFVIRLTHSAHTPPVTGDIIYLRDRIRTAKIWISYLYDFDPAQELDEVIQKEIDLEKGQIAEWDRQNTLYLADTAEILGQLQDAGYYAIALRHEGNGQEDFSRAIYEMTEIREMQYDSFLKAYQRLAGLPWHIADTGRLTLRETTVADVEEFYRIYSDPAITRYMEPLYLEIEAEKAYVQDYINHVYGFYGYGIWTVLLKSTGEIIGRAGISWREGSRYPELGFIIDRKHQRLGYAEEVCRAILGLAGEELELAYLQVLVEPGNEPSLALCRKLGFIFRETVLLNGHEHLRLLIDVRQFGGGS